MVSLSPAFLVAVVCVCVGLLVVARVRAPRESPAACVTALELPLSTPVAELVVSHRIPAGDGGALTSSPRRERTQDSDRTARTEKEYLHDFLALAESEPGALEARAEAVLFAAGPEAEKLALLRALLRTRSESFASLAERFVRSTTDARIAEELDLASTALGFLLKDAARDARARTALRRIAFDEPLADLALRRRAAAAFARLCDELELATLDSRLLRQSDALLAEGVLSAAADREPSAARSRLLLAHGRAENDPTTEH